MTKSDKPNIVKINTIRNIGFTKKGNLMIEEHTGLDDKGNTWSWLAYIEPFSGKVKKTEDYRKL